MNIPNGEKPQKSARRGDARKTSPPPRPHLQRERIQLRSQAPHRFSAEPAADGGNLSVAELATLRVFRDYRIAVGQMFCFTGPTLQKHGKSLDQLVEKDLLEKEQFGSGYSMTAAGYRAMMSARGR